ncbi:MAG: NAD(P)-binding domain-containing protein [Acidobacteriaceae bacterium]|jgi:2-dehydropantoate 2-reductase|nr:NAD(P)-binding domain-containing protein [Acidobacteriaceae bacterium]
MPQSIAIIGAGNLGSWLAVHLARAGHSVHLCTRRDPGPLHIEGLPPLTLPHYLDVGPPADVAFLTTKTYDTPAALIRVNAPVLAAIQNGLSQPGIPVLSYVYIEPQQGMRQAFPPPGPHFTIPAGTPLPELFRHTPIAVQEAPDFLSAAWRKMLHNCVSNPLTALAGRGLEILREPLYRRWAEKLLAEALPIAAASGARVDGPDILAKLASYPPGTRTSMLQDRLAGKPLELAALNGHLIELGRQFSLPTPAHENLLTLL